MGNLHTAILTASVFLLCCNGGPTSVETPSKPEKQENTADNLGAILQLPSEDQTPQEGPGGEMMPSAMLPSMGGTPSQPLGGTSKKSDREDLLKTANEALERQDLDEATSFADVILLLYPNDAEALEIRGRALILQGDKVGGLADLKSCCKKGRMICCKPK